MVAAGGASSICALVLANLVGFGAGDVGTVLANLDATLRLLFLSREGRAAAAIAWALIFVGVHSMIDLERWRRGERSGSKPQ